MMPSRRRPGSVHITAPSFAVGARSSVYRRIAYTFIALTIVIVVAVLWLTSVRAEVTVKVKRESVKLDGVVEIAKQPQTGQIPGRVVQGVFEKVQEFPVQGEAGAPANPAAPTPVVPTPAPAPVIQNDNVIARGTVKIYNKYSSAQTLVRTTRLLAPNGDLYRIDAQVNVPAGGSVTVAAYADKQGSQYVLTAPTTFTIPGLHDTALQKLIYAESVGSFTASAVGSSKTTTPPPAATPTDVPTKPKNGKLVVQADLDNAQKTLNDAVMAQAMSALGDEVPEKDHMDVVYVVKVVDSHFMVRPGDIAETFLASVKLDVTAVYYSKDDMMSLVRSRLKEKVPDGREFLPFDGGAVTYSLESSDPKTETASIRVSADATYRLSPSSPLLQKTVIAGKSKSDAESILKAVDGVDTVTIDIKPGWLDTIPTLQDRIDLKVE